MSKVNRARKRQIREAVRNVARTAIHSMELASEELENLSDEELAYAERFKADLAEGMVITEKVPADEPEQPA
jgi:hypothetical protein